MKALVLIIVLALCGAVSADQTIYGPDGRRIVTKDRDGRDTGYYDRDGRRYESSRGYGDNRRYYDSSGKLEYEREGD